MLLMVRAARDRRNSHFAIWDDRNSHFAAWDDRNSHFAAWDYRNSHFGLPGYLHGLCLPRYFHGLGARPTRILPRIMSKCEIRRSRAAMAPNIRLPKEFLKKILCFMFHVWGRSASSKLAFRHSSVEVSGHDRLGIVETRTLA